MANYNNSRIAMSTSAAMITMLLTMALVMQPVSAQSGASSEVTTSYRSSYPKASVDSESSFAVQSQYHIYKPGDSIRVEGSMSSEMKEETQADSVMVNITDAQGQVVANEQASVNSNGEFSTAMFLPGSAEDGEYSVDSKIEVQASILGILDAQILANLESSSQFVIGSHDSYDVTAEGGEEFQVEVTSNSDVSAVELSQSEKKVSFTVEGATGTEGVTEVTIPKAMLSGEMMVFIDGQAMTDSSNDVIVKSNTNTEVTFEINYDHSEHDVEVQGTNVVPEFPVSILVMTAAFASIIAGVAVARRQLNYFRM